MVLTIVCTWGRRHVANLYRQLDTEHHRTRFHNFFLVERGDPAAALRQKAHELLQGLSLRPGTTVSLVIDDARKAQRGQTMAAVAKMKDSTSAAYIRGHQYVCAIPVCGDQVIPLGIRLSGKQADGPV